MSGRTLLISSQIAAALLVCSPGTAQPAVGEPKFQSSHPNSAYKLQPDDEITVRSLQVKELADKVFRLDQKGGVNFPLIGRMSLGGGTVSEAEESIAEKLKKFYVEPDVQLSVAANHVEPVSVIGAVGNPGVRLMKDQMTLLDALSASGGVRPEAGSVVVVTREGQYGPIPYSSARTTLSGQSVAEVNLRQLLDSKDPRDNFLIQPHDVISVPPAQMVYVEGKVKRAGGFSLSGRPGLSVLQAIALAEGVDAGAAMQNARILRGDGEAKQLIPVNLKMILANKAEDIALKPNDILFVPNSAMKVITARTIEAAIAIGSGLAIFRF